MPDDHADDAPSGVDPHPIDALSDQEFLAALAAGDLPRFNHRDHLRMAFAFLQRDGQAALGAQCMATIRALAASAGLERKFHATRTQAWAHLVASAAADRPDLTFAAMLAAHPELLRGDRLNDFWSVELLTSEQARLAWVEPDLAPLPSVPIP